MPACRSVSSFYVSGGLWLGWSLDREETEEPARYLLKRVGRAIAVPEKDDVPRRPDEPAGITAEAESAVTAWHWASSEDGLREPGA